MGHPLLPRHAVVTAAFLALAAPAAAEVLFDLDPARAPRPAGVRLVPGGDGPPTLRLAPGAVLEVPIEVAAPAEVKGVAAQAWFARFDADVREAEGLELHWRPAEGGGARCHAFELAPVRGREHLRWSGRLGALDSAARAGGSGTLVLRAGPGGAALEGLALTRHHAAPTRALRGKENGKLGPDQLACGMLGFTALTEHEHRAFSVLDVREGGPAHAAGLRVGDVVVGVDGVRLAPSSIAPGWRWFEESHEAVLGRAIEGALAEGRAAVSLTVERSSIEAAERLVELRLALPVEGATGPSFPLRGTHAPAFRADLVRWALGHQRKDGTWPGSNAVNVALGALALLGTGEPAHREAVERAVEFLLKTTPSPSEMKGLAYWQLSFQGILFCELVLGGSDDERLLPWIREAVAWLPTTTHTSKWGTQAFGHGPDGLPYDDKALMAPTAHLLVFDALARRCAVESRVFEHVEPYVRHAWSDPEQGGHGAMGYNGSHRDKGEFWSRTGLCALAEVLRGDDAAMAPHLVVLMEERHPWMLNSHAYGEPGGALGLLSLAVVAPELFESLVPMYRWRFLNAWEPGYGLRYTSPHMGAPYMGEEAILNLAYLLLLATENDGLVVAGG